MSYEIIYNKQFISAGDKIVPIVQIGSNNCYEFNNKKRARDWYALPKFGNLVSPETILNTIDVEFTNLKTEYENKNGKPFDQKDWGYETAIAVGSKGTRGTSFMMYRNVFSDGIKNAKTVEELKTNYIDIEVFVYVNDPTDFFNKTGLETKPRVNITTTEQLLTTLKEYNEYYGINTFVHVTYKYSDFSIVHMQKQNRPKRVPKPKKTVNNFFVLYSKRFGYFVKKTARGIKYYSNYSDLCKKFISAKEAEKLALKLKHWDYDVLAYHSEKPIQL